MKPCDLRNKVPTTKFCFYIQTCRSPLLIFRNFVERQLGAKYIENRGIDFLKTFEESSRSTPLFFVLSPGVDPLKDVEALGLILKFICSF